MTRGNFVSKARRFLDVLGLSPAFLSIPVALACGAALLEGATVALLIPLTKGILRMDFSFVREAALGRLPFPVPASDKVVFGLLVGTLFILSVSKCLFEYGCTTFVSFLVRRFANNIRKLMFHRLMSFGKLYFDRQSAGHLHGLLINSTSTIAFRLTDMRQFVTGMFALMAYFAVMFSISWKLTLGVLLFFPVLTVSLKSLIQRIRATSRRFADAQTEINRLVSNVLSGIALVKSYAMEDSENRRFDAASDSVEAHEFSIDKKLNLVPPLQEVIVLGMVLALVSAMALAASERGVDKIPGFLVFFYALRRAVVSFGVVNHAKASLATVSGPISDIEEIFHDREKFIVPDGDLEFSEIRDRIEFKELSHSYIDGRLILDRVSFSVARGSMTAIVGASGAGKTTLVSLLARFYDCAPGAILLDGTDIRTYSRSSLARSIALVSQDTLLFNDTFRANIGYGLSPAPTEARVREALAQARLSDFIASQRDGLDVVIGDRGVQLSGGERQRVSLARALLKGASILVLDEATSSLDSRTERLIQEAIDEIVKGKTAIVIAHRFSTIKKADKIVVLDKGSVVECGRLEELLDRRGAFHQLWQEQKFF